MDKEERQKAAVNAAMERCLKRVLTLSGALLRADVLFERYQIETQALIESGLSDDELLEEHLEVVKRLEAGHFARAETFLSFHFTALQAVVEKWGKWDFADPEVSRLLTSPLAGCLRDYRHVIAHAGEYDEKALAAFAEQRQAVTWASELSNALRSVLREWHSNTEKMMIQHLLRAGV